MQAALSKSSAVPPSISASSRRAASSAALHAARVSKLSLTSHLATGHGGVVAIVIVEPGDVAAWNHQIPADQGERSGVVTLHVKTVNPTATTTRITKARIA
jgi:hypothetical protein